MPDIDRIIEKRLFDQRRSVALLKSPSGKPLPACTGERCAQAFRLACPQTQGRILGGQAFEGKIVRTRLWLYDLDTGQIAYQDDYCHTCNIIGALAVHGRSLIEHPRFGSPSAPGPIPSYCAARPEIGVGGAKAGPLFLTVYGQGAHKGAVLMALKAQLSLLGRQLLPMPFEPKNYGSEVLEKIVAGQQDARVLMVDVQKEGNAAVYLYDQRTAKVDAKEVKCPACESEHLNSQIKEAVSDLLNRCSGDQCAEAVLSGAVQAPVDAWEPFPTDVCSSPQLDALLSASAPAAVSSGLDPKAARLIKGLVWGAFTASAATAVGLFAANAAGAGRLVGDAEMNTQPLLRPAYTATALAAITLGVAIPTTLVLHRAQQKATHVLSPSLTTSAIQCPN